MKTGYQAGTKTFKAHLDGFDLTALLKGESDKPPRDAVYYFDQCGNLNAIRWNDWKLAFAQSSEGNIATATRETTSWAMITNDLAHGHPTGRILEAVDKCSELRDPCC